MRYTEFAVKGTQCTVRSFTITTTNKGLSPVVRAFLLHGLREVTVQETNWLAFLPVSGAMSIRFKMMIYSLCSCFVLVARGWGWGVAKKELCR